ncbi:hypothetical protein OUZ56_006110 [Daphnia magna]|uniref:Uncharacterized protein n=1 Tax=Daphnia magna TaxID=35525 RepID=A0ABQ9YUQ8_9CRUS|nr:hypothetical protein OUZ56_006110 [Daphnia magna]
MYLVQHILVDEDGPSKFLLACMLHFRFGNLVIAPPDAASNRYHVVFILLSLASLQVGFIAPCPFLSNTNARTSYPEITDRDRKIWSDDNETPERDDISRLNTNFVEERPFIVNPHP